MTVVQRVRKPSSHVGKKFLVQREPKLIENPKQTLFLYGKHPSETVVKCIKDLYSLKKPEATLMGKKNDLLPFENATLLERFSRKHDSSLFVFGSNTKKRPHNITIGRMYDHQLLDMVEFGVENFKSLSTFATEKIAVGIKPCILFAGPLFDQNPDYKRIQNLLVDFFQREKVDCIRLQGIEHVVMFTAHSDCIYMRSYRVLLKKSGCHTPRIELEEIGPAMDLRLRRMKLASEDLFKLACKQPKQLKAKKVKNISRDAFGSKLGRVHIRQQSLDKLQTRKLKGLRKTPAEKKKNKEK